MIASQVCTIYTISFLLIALCVQMIQVRASSFVSFNCLFLHAFMALSPVCLYLSRVLLVHHQLLTSHWTSKSLKILNKREREQQEQWQKTRNIRHKHENQMETVIWFFVLSSIEKRIFEDIKSYASLAKRIIWFWQIVCLNE